MLNGGGGGGGRGLTESENDKKNAGLMVDEDRGGEGAFCSLCSAYVGAKNRRGVGGSTESERLQNKNVGLTVYQRGGGRRESALRILLFVCSIHPSANRPYVRSCVHASTHILLHRRAVWLGGYYFLFVPSVNLSVHLCIRLSDHLAMHLAPQGTHHHRYMGKFTGECPSVCPPVRR